MNDGAAAVHGSALVAGSSYRWCAAGSGGWALAPITGTAGAGLGCPGVRPFRVEDDDASMTSAAVCVGVEGSSAGPYGWRIADGKYPGASILF